MRRADPTIENSGRSPRWLLGLGAALVACLACGGGSPSPSPSQPGDSGEPSNCADKGIVHVLPTDSHHTATCSETCGNGLSPPTGGPHCPIWLACRVYDSAQPLCSWVHNLEHGHAVLLYNCPEGCPEIVDALKAVWTEEGTGGRPRRILITPDPTLPKKVGAVVWGWSWTGDAFDADAIKCVLSHQDQDAPEAGLSCAQ